jgi:hypothetical protein
MRPKGLISESPRQEEEKGKGTILKHGGKKWGWGERAGCETTTDEEMEKRRALFSMGVRAGSGSERDDERKGSPLYR